MTRREAADYIATLVDELKSIAQAAGLPLIFCRRFKSYLRLQAHRRGSWKRPWPSIMTGRIGEIRGLSPRY
jgi:hypothetical protein